jgi:hypothetical protein
MLLRLRDGNGTKDDWNTLNNTCSFSNKNEEYIRSFRDTDTTWLFHTNEDNLNHNLKMLRHHGQPIVRIDALHDDNSSSSASKSSEFTRRLSSTLYLSRGSKIMLLWNINSNIGLVNGATGIVKDFLYEEGKSAPTLPQIIVVQMNSYTGPPFFTNPGQENWIPLLPQTYTWSSTNEKIEHFRTQFPIALAWGLTVWKAQGMTISTKLRYDLGKSEPEAGITYVALSRVTDINNICIGNGCTLDRYTKCIQSNKKLSIRILEDVRLNKLADETIVYFFP